MKFELPRMKSLICVFTSLFLGIITSFLIKDIATPIFLAGKTFINRSLFIQISIFVFLAGFTSVFFFLILSYLFSLYICNEKLQKVVTKIFSLLPIFLKINIPRFFYIFNPVFIFLITLIVAGYFSTIGVDPHHDGILIKPAFDLASGKILFKETFTQYGALTTIIQALALKIFGRYLITIRLLTAFFYALISSLLYLIFKRFLPKLILFTSLLIWLFMAPYYVWTFLPWSSIYALFFQLLTTYLLILFFEKKTQIYFILASISTALIFWCRQPVGVFTFLAINAYFIYIFFNKQIKKQIFTKYLIEFFFINFLVSFIFIIYFILNDSLIDWWKQSILLAFHFNQTYGSGFDILGVIRSLFPISLSPLSIWVLIPIFTLLLMVTNYKNKFLPLIIFIGLASWLQYYPVACIRHFYWGATPMVPLFCLFIYQLCQQFILSNLNLHKNLVKYFSVLIIIISFLPDISYRAKNGLLKINTSYQYLEQPAVLKGMKIDQQEAVFYQYMSQEITNYFEKNPQGNVVTNGPNALYLTFDSKINNIQPMYVSWALIDDSIYTNSTKILNDYIERYKPLLISYGDQLPPGYCRLDDISNNDSASLSQPCSVLN